MKLTVPDFVLGLLFLSLTGLALAGGWLLCEYAIEKSDARKPPRVIQGKVLFPDRCPCCPCPDRECEPGVPEDDE